MAAVDCIVIKCSELIRLQIKQFGSLLLRPARHLHPFLVLVLTFICQHCICTHWKFNFQYFKFFNIYFKLLQYLYTGEGYVQRGGGDQKATVESEFWTWTWDRTTCQAQLYLTGPFLIYFNYTETITREHL